MIPVLNGKVWTFGPSFRAERKVDNRHLTEFSLLELEFEGNFEKLLFVLEDLITAMIRNLDSIDNAICRIELEHPFKRLKYEEAVRKLGLTFGDDLSAVNEQKLIEFNKWQPLFVTHFPKELKYFNMRINDEDPRVVDSADLLLPGAGESAGAAEREFNSAILRKRLFESNMWNQFIARGGDVKAFDWYLDLYDIYPYMLHSGFGIGLNRVTKFVLKTGDIRQTTVYATNAETLY